MENFPFIYEKYIVNEKIIIKFINPDTQLYGLCQYKPNKIYILNYNNRLYIIFYVPENGFELFYYYDELKSYFLTQNNIKITRESLPLFKYLYLIYTASINNDIIFFFKKHLNVELDYCFIDKVELDLTNIKERINELNMYLFLNCENKYKINLDYVYRMNNIIAYSNLDIMDEANSIFICLNLNNKCVSSIDFNITIMSDLKCVSITSKTMDEYEGNKFNKFLRAICMIIAPYFDVTHLYSSAHSPISALLMIKLFDNNEYDESFMKYLNKNKLREEELDFRILNKYINRKDEIDIYSPVNELNIKKATDIFIDLSGKLPCDI